MFGRSVDPFYRASLERLTGDDTVNRPPTRPLNQNPVSACPVDLSKTQYLLEELAEFTQHWYAQLGELNLGSY